MTEGVNRTIRIAATMPPAPLPRDHVVQLARRL